MSEEVLRDRRNDEGDDEEEDDEDRARDRELVSAEADQCLPVAAGGNCRNLIALLGELSTEEASSRSPWKPCEARRPE